ncbi:MAG TPA: DUF3616 domain-containing protein [Polyangiaceae bacterium]
MKRLGVSSRAVLATLLFVLSPACNDIHAATRKAPAPVRTPVRLTSSAGAETPVPAGADRVVTFRGACDASGAVELDARRFAVADDEDNVIRVYDADRGGEPLLQVDLSPSLPLEKSWNAESDFEAATRLGDAAYFLASHGRTSKGKRDPDRALFFATSLPAQAAAPALVGKPYRSLLDDLANDPGLRPFALHEAALRSPKAPGGLNLEGLTADPAGGLLLGFRSPIPEGRALLVRMLNPQAMLAGERVRFSEPFLLDLQGLGVRSLSTWGKRFLIIAGPSGDGGPFGLFRFDGRTAVEPVPGLDFEGFGPEGFFTPESRDELMVLSDDGTRVMHGKACKKLKDTKLKSFRGVWLKLAK